MKLFAIDPGPVQSAYVLYDVDAGRPVEFDIVPTTAMRWVVDRADADALAIEMVASYGMPVGADVFETCVNAGRFLERWALSHGGEVVRVKRLEVKTHLCHDSRAKDSNIRAALIDRYGGKDRAVGRKAEPGPLYGVSKDVWAALAVAVTAAETSLGGLAQQVDGGVDAA